MDQIVYKLESSKLRADGATEVVFSGTLGKIKVTESMCVEPRPRGDEAPAVSMALIDLPQGGWGSTRQKIAEQIQSLLSAK